MDINNILTTIEEYFSAKKDFVSGQLSKSDLDSYKDRFAKALNEYIEHRLSIILDRIGK
jgi:hypothetical protein